MQLGSELVLCGAWAVVKFGSMGLKYQITIVTTFKIMHSCGATFDRNLNVAILLLTILRLLHN